MDEGFHLEFQTKNNPEIQKTCTSPNDTKGQKGKKQPEEITRNGEETTVDNERERWRVKPRQKQIFFKFLFIQQKMKSNIAWSFHSA